MANAMDPQKYRITADGITYTTVLPETALSRRRNRPGKLFTQFPWLWLDVLAKPRASSATFLVAAVLLYEAWQLSSHGLRPVVKLTNAKLRRVGVDRRAKRVALLTLERRKLVSVERRGRKSPQVTVHFFE